MALMLTRDAWMRAIEETGHDSRLSRTMEYAYGIAVDCIDYEALRSEFDRGELAEPKRLPAPPPGYYFDDLRSAFASMRRALGCDAPIVERSDSL